MPDDLTPAILATAVVNQELGESAKQYSLALRSARIELEKSGQLKPCTILNFNPVRLKIEDGNVRTIVPAATDEIKRGLTIQHGGRRYAASYVTLTNAVAVPWVRQVRLPSPDSSEPVADYDPKFILPLEQGDRYFRVYNDPTQQNMGGVVVYEGDIHSFTKNSSVLRIPAYTELPNRSRAYYSEEANAEALISQQLEKQQLYCESMIRRGDEFNQTEAGAVNITGVMRTWAQFGMDMGWLSVSPAWMNPRINTLEGCKKCGKAKTRADALACECGRYYDPFGAFMKGEDVPESYIFSFQGEELELAKKELGRREALRKELRAAGAASAKASS